MSESDVKVLLKSMKKLKAKKEILNCVKKPDDEYEKLSKIILPVRLDFMGLSSKVCKFF